MVMEVGEARGAADLSCLGDASFPPTCGFQLDAIQSSVHQQQISCRTSGMTVDGGDLSALHPQQGPLPHGKTPTESFLLSTSL